jgi:hypothetical protein
MGLLAAAVVYLFIYLNPFLSTERCTLYVSMLRSRSIEVATPYLTSVLYAAMTAIEQF